MLSWFRKKPDVVSLAAPGTQPSPTNTEARIDAIARSWDANIASLLKQSDAMLTRASAENDAALASLGSDLQVLSRIWSRTEAPHHALAEQLGEVWNAVCDDLATLAPPEEVMNREGAKRDLSNNELQLRYTRAYRFGMARAADELKRRADGGDEASRAVFAGSFARSLQRKPPRECSRREPISEVIDALAPRVPIAFFPKLTQLGLLSKDALDGIARTAQKLWFRFRWVRRDPTVDFLGVCVSVAEVSEQASQHFTCSESIARDVLIQVLSANVFELSKGGLDQ